MNIIAHNSEPLKRPPYSAYLCAALNHPETWPQYAGTSADGSRVSIFLVVGSGAWNKAHKIENNHLFAMLPPGDDPLLYVWHALAGHDPVIALIEGDPPSKEEYQNIATALIRDGVKRFIRPGSGGRNIRYLAEDVIK